jgi:hypothetical protein
MAKQEFPENIYVKIEQDGSDVYFVANDDPLVLAEAGQKIKVALYKKVEINSLELVANFHKIK